MARVFIILLVLSPFLLSTSVSARQARVRAEPLPSSSQDSTATESTGPKSVLRRQFENPSETLSVLLLIGGDIVQRAIAQLVGGHTITPAAFSFGWVAYAFSGLTSAFGDGTLMPLPDCPCRVINLETGGYRQNESWVIGRLLRDLEVNFKLPPGYRKPTIIFLKTTGTPAKPGGDLVWWSFVLIMPMQLFIAAWPLILPRRNWTILMITAIGSLLAIATSSLPQWAAEKFACRTDSKNNYIVTRGNGHEHIFVIENGGLVPRQDQPGKFRGISLNLEDLAVTTPDPTSVTRIASIILAILWVLFLITVGGLEQDTWFLMGVGGLGMLHNVYVASRQRTPEGHGVPLRRKEDGRLYVSSRIGPDEELNSMKLLMKAEETCAGIGLLLLDTFFPGNLSIEEAEFWTEKRKTLGQRQEDLKETLANQAEKITVTANPRSIGWQHILEILNKVKSYLSALKQRLITPQGETADMEKVGGTTTSTGISKQNNGEHVEVAEEPDDIARLRLPAEQALGEPSLITPLEDGPSPGRVRRSSTFHIPSSKI